MRVPTASNFMNSFKISENPSKLLTAIQFGNLESLAEVIAAGVDTDHFFRLCGESKPALLFAVERNNFAIVELLIKNGSSVNLQASNNGITCLHAAAESGSSSICKLLLKHRASVNVVTESGISPLHLAVSRGSLEVVNLLISHGADVNRKDNFGSAPIHYACRSPRLNTEIIRLLVQQGAKVDEADKTGFTPLLYSLNNALKCKFEIVELLVETSPVTVNQSSRTGETALHMIAESINKDKLKCLDYLLKKGANVNALTHQKQNAIYLSVCAGDVEAVKILLRANGNPNAVDLLGVSPFALAVRLNYPDILDVLLNVGVRPDKKYLQSHHLKTLSNSYRQSLLNKLQTPPTLMAISRNSLFKQFGPFTVEIVEQLCGKEIPAVTCPYILLEQSEN